MKTTLLYLIIMFAHFVGDYVLQSDEMASKKSKSNKWLLAHLAGYTIPLIVISIFLFQNVLMGVCWLLVNVVIHGVQDYFTSRLNSKLYVIDRHKFYVAIGFDQFLHVCMLLISYQLIS